MRVLSRVFLACIVACLTQMNLSGQESPAFSTPFTHNTSLSTGVSNSFTTTPYTSNSTAAVLYGFSADSNDASIHVWYSLDGTNYTASDVLKDQTGTIYHVYCDGSGLDCGASAAVYNNHLYIAFADQATRVLKVVQATLIPNNPGYQFSYQTVYTGSSLQLTGQPGIVTYNGKLMVVYGTFVGNPKNESFTTILDNTNTWTTVPNETFAPGLSGLVVFHNVLYCFQKANNESASIVESVLNGDGILQPQSQISLPASFQSRSGMTAAMFNNYIVLAARGSNSTIYIYSSSDSANWYADALSGNTTKGTPGVSQFNGGLALAQGAQNGPTLWSTFATH